MLKSFSIKIDTGYVSSIIFDTRYYNIQVLQVKNFVESYFVIYCSEYASGVRNLFCQGELQYKPNNWSAISCMLFIQSTRFFYHRLSKQIIELLSLSQSAIKTITSFIREQLSKKFRQHEFHYIRGPTVYCTETTCCASRSYLEV